MKKLATAAITALGMLAAPAIASATTTAYTNSAVGLRAGPDAGYPRVATLRAGTPLQVHGCINDWSWCDVATGYDRGWVSGGYLDYVDHGRRVAVNRYGDGIGLPIVHFVFNTYWDNHYRNRAWYSQRKQWLGYRPPVHRAVVVRPQPRPLIVARSQPVRSVVAVKPQPPRPVIIANPLPKQAIVQRQPQQQKAQSRNDKQRQAAWRNPARMAQQAR